MYTFNDACVEMMNEAIHWYSQLFCRKNLSRLFVCACVCRLLRYPAKKDQKGAPWPALLGECEHLLPCSIQKRSPALSLNERLCTHLLLSSRHGRPLLGA